MMTITIAVTIAQAQRIAAQTQALQATLELLTLGTSCYGLTLASVNVEDGTLVFHHAPVEVISAEQL